MFRLFVFTFLFLSTLGAQSKAVTIQFLETGSSVVAELSGSLDLTGASLLRSSLGTNTSFVASGSGRLTADDNIMSALGYYDIVGPTSFGTVLTGTLASSNTSNLDFTLCAECDYFGNAGTGTLLIENGFDDVAWAGLITFAGQSFASLGLVEGNYDYFLTNGEKFTISIGVATVPLPASLPLLVLTLGLLGLIGHRKRRS